MENCVSLGLQSRLANLHGLHVCDWFQLTRTYANELSRYDGRQAPMPENEERGVWGGEEAIYTWERALHMLFFKILEDQISGDRF